MEYRNRKRGQVQLKTGRIKRKGIAFKVFFLENAQRFCPSETAVVTVSSWNRSGLSLTLPLRNLSSFKKNLYLKTR